MSVNDFSYIGRKPECGCVVAAVVDTGVHGNTDRDTVARWVSEMIQDGLIVERVTHDYVRENLRRCPHGQLAMVLAPAGEAAGDGR